MLCPLSCEHHLTTPHAHLYIHTCAARSLDLARVSLLHTCSFPPSPIPPWPTQTLSHAPLSPAGEITTTSLLDRETKSEYILIVRAVDGGVGHNQKTGIATVSAWPSPAPSSPLASQAAAPSSSSACTT